MKDKQLALTLAKELQEYTRVVGSHNQKINQTADQLVECLVSPSLTDNQHVVLEWLTEEYKRTKWSSPFGTVYSTINIHEMFVRMRLTKAQQFQVLAAFAEWGLSNA